MDVATFLASLREFPLGEMRPVYKAIGEGEKYQGMRVLVFWGIQDDLVPHENATFFRNTIKRAVLG